MKSEENGRVDVLLERVGGVDVWLMPLSLIGCVVILGPLMALGFDRMPGYWMHERTVEVATVLTAASGVVLVAAYYGARTLVRMRHRLLRVEDDLLSLYNRKGTSQFIEAPRHEVAIQRCNWVVEGPSGTEVTPVLRMRAPGTEWLSMTVVDPTFRWDEEVGECEEDAEFVLSTDGWDRLLGALEPEDFDAVTEER